MPSNKPISIVLIIILYLYIYNPVLRWPGFGFNIVLMIFGLIYVILKYGTSRKYLHYYRAELILSLLMIPYVLVICLANGEDDLQVISELITWVIMSTCVPIFLVRELLARCKGLVFWDAVLFVGFIASLISCIALFVPGVNLFLREIQLEITGGQTEEQMAFRFFGLAINLSSAFGYMQGLLASLCLLRIDKNHKRYALYFLTMIISVIINARTGLFPIFLTVLYLVVNAVIKFRVGQLLKLTIASAFAFISASFIIGQLPDVTDFVMDFFDQLSVMFLEDNNGLENSAYVTMLKFPETVTGLIFGEGRSLYGIGAGESSDIGYVNQIFLGGIIFAGSLIIYEIILYRQILKKSREKVFSTIFFFSLLAFNYKGFNFYAGGAYIKVWILYYYVLVHNQINSKNRIPLFSVQQPDQIRKPGTSSGRNSK